MTPEQQALYYRKELKEAEDKIVLLEAEAKAVREALEKYGSHEPKCAYYGENPFDSSCDNTQGKCDCGLDRALNSGKE